MTFVVPSIDYNIVVRAILKENGDLEVVRRYPCNSMFTCHPAKPVPDRVTKEIYRVKEGKIVLDEVIEGKHIPQHTVSESITFD